MQSYNYDWEYNQKQQRITTLDIWGILWEECQTLAELYFTKEMSEAWSEGKAARMFWEHSMTFFHGCQVTNKARLTNDYVK